MVAVARGPRRVAPPYDRCPLCGSPRIKFGFEHVDLPRPGKRLALRVRCWSCPNCGERFLTASARRQTDAAPGLTRKGRTAS